MTKFKQDLNPILVRNAMPVLDEAERVFDNNPTQRGMVICQLKWENVIYKDNMILQGAFVPNEYAERIKAILIEAGIQ